MTQIVRYIASWFHVGAGGYSEAKYEAGKFYPVTDETERHIAHGIAELVDAPDDATKAVAAAEAAETKADKAAEAATAAQSVADAAVAAAVIAAAPQADAATKA